MSRNTTTVKVSCETRDAIKRQAAVAHKTADQHPSQLVVEDVWRQRVAQARADMAAEVADCARETAEWDSSVAAGGLD